MDVASSYLMVIAITLLVVALAAARGGRPEQFCAAIIAGELATDFVLMLALGPRSFRTFDGSRMLIDVIVAALFIAIAMRANRVYPLAIAASQIVAIIASVAVLLASDGRSQAFWAMTQLPIFLQLVLLAAGTAAHRMRLSRIGPYNCWSPVDDRAPLLR